MQHKWDFLPGLGFVLAFWTVSTMAQDHSAVCEKEVEVFEPLLKLS